MSGTFGRIVSGIVGAVAGFIFLGPIGAIAGFALAETAESAAERLLKKPSSAPQERLLTSLVTDTPRTIVFGHTALATDIRYEEWWGAEQEYFSEVILNASHWCEAVEQIWINTDLAWTAIGGTQGAYVRYFFVAAHPQATPASVYTDDWSNRWGANAAFTGCATLYLHFRVLGLNDKAGGPFSGSIPTRITIRGKGARLYDPRRDDTAGGSGPMRVADQTTWRYVADDGVEIGRNPALALLFYLLGWRIQNPVTGTWKLVVGRGVPVERIDIASFMTAANLCDEMVYKGDGTQEPRYRADGIFSEGDDPKDVFTAFENTMNGKLRDWGGRLALQLFHDDLATPVAHFDEGDVLGPVDWDAGSDIPKNVVKGKYVDPSDSGLYQQVDYPSVSLASLDGIDRIDTLTLPLVQSPDQAQRLAKQKVERNQYPGAFTGTMNAKAWGVKDGDTVTLSFSRFGWVAKLFRVDMTTVDQTGACPMKLIEENSGIYAAFSDTRPAPTPAAPIRYDPTKAPWMQALEAASARAAYQVIRRDVAYPISTDAGSITIAAFNGTLDGDGGIVSFPAATLTGLLSGADYMVVYALVDAEQPLLGADGTPLLGANDEPLTATLLAGSYAAIPAPGLKAAADGRLVILPRDATTANGDGSYPAPTAPPPGDAGGSYGGGTSCPTEDMPFLTANADHTGPGAEIPAGEVTTATWAWTQHELTGEWGAFRVTAASKHRSAVVLADAKHLPQALAGVPVRALRASPRHRIGGTPWTRLEAIGRPDGEATVVRVTVGGAATYVVSGVLSHNLKPISDDL